MILPFTSMKYIQMTRDNQHVVKMKGTNIILSDDDIDKLIALLGRIKSGEEEPLNKQQGE